MHQGVLSLTMIDRITRSNQMDHLDNNDERSTHRYYGYRIHT